MNRCIEGLRSEPTRGTWPSLKHRVRTPDAHYLAGLGLGALLEGRWRSCDTIWPMTLCTYPDQHVRAFGSRLVLRFRVESPPGDMFRASYDRVGWRAGEGGSDVVGQVGAEDFRLSLWPTLPRMTGHQDHVRVRPVGGAR